jgi:exopolysaccharide biosynthesis protein
VESRKADDVRNGPGRAGLRSGRQCLGLLLLAGFLLASAATAEDWTPVAPGVEYRRVLRDGLDAHAVRADLREKSIAVVATAEHERGLTVSGFAQGRRAITAVNGDYFDASLVPVGLAMGDGEVWARADERLRRQEVIGVGGRRVAIFPRAHPLRQPKRWMTGAVSGWPMVVQECKAVAALLGSDHFTRAAHPRTAVGLSKDRRRLLLVVADGRREGVPGPTLPELAALMVELGACTAVNLDGGGSSALWLRDRIVNQPSDGAERRVANHLAVVESARNR